MSNFVHLLAPSENAAVVLEGSTALPMAPASGSQKAAADARLEQVEPRRDADVDAIVQESLKQLTGAKLQVSNEAIVLFSSGEPETALQGNDVNTLKERGASLLAIGFDNEQADHLRRLASETGGEYLYARNAAELQFNVLSALAAIRSHDVIEGGSGTLLPGASQDFSVFVDRYTAKDGIEFLLAWSGGGQGPQLELTDPRGRKTSVEGRESTEDPTSTIQFRISRPARGQWRARVINRGSSRCDFGFQAHSLTGSTVLAAFAEEDIVQFPQPLLLRAAVSVVDPVGGAHVIARIGRPSGEVLNVSLFDDGKLEHADDRANDGMYSAVFDSFYGSGTYNVTVEADTEDAFEVSPEARIRWKKGKVPRFVRERSFSVIVKGAPTQEMSGAPR